MTQEFTPGQTARLDEIYQATQTFLSVLLQADVGYDMALLGPVADYAADTLVRYGFSLCFPTRVDDEAVSDSYLPA